MMPITAHPTTVSKLGDKFKNNFSDSNFLHFKNYLTGLIVSDNKTVAGMNRQLAIAGNQSSLNRFLTDTNWDANSINKQRIELLKQNQNTKPKKDGVVSIDDTLIPKSGKHMEAVGKFWDHCEHKYVMAHNMVTSHYWDEHTTYPLHFRTYFKKDMIDSSEFKTKIEFAIELVNDAESCNLGISTYVFDSWFCTKKLTHYIRDIGKNWVSQVKSNRLVLHNGYQVRLSKYLDEYVKPDQYKSVVVKTKDETGKEKETTHYCFTKSITIKELGRIRIVVCYQNKELKGKRFILGTNRTNWSQPKKIIDTYSKRWPIETFYRDSKQSLGFSSYRFRNIQSVKKHMSLVFLAYSFLEISRRQTASILNKVKTKLHTIGETARIYSKEIFKELLYWIKQQFDQNQNVNTVYRLLIK